MNAKKAREASKKRQVVDFETEKALYEAIINIIDRKIEAATEQGVQHISVTSDRNEIGLIVADWDLYLVQYGANIFKHFTGKGYKVKAKRFLNEDDIEMLGLRIAW